MQDRYKQTNSVCLLPLIWLNNYLKTLLVGKDLPHVFFFTLRRNLSQSDRENPPKPQLHSTSATTPHCRRAQTNKRPHRLAPCYYFLVHQNRVFGATNAGQVASVSLN